MTRLTKDKRTLIINRIMADIPAVDIKALAEKEVEEAALKLLPAKVREVWNDSALRPYVRTGRVSTGCGAIYTHIPAHADWLSKDESRAAIGDDAWQKLMERCAELRKQNEDRAQIYNELAANFSSVTTHKQFIERFPQFEKYLPVVRGVVSNLPATTNLIDRLSAAGWKAGE